MEQIQIELKLPDEPFIAVFGSSHTHGDCRRGESQHIAKDQIWTSLLSKSLGIRVVNFAVPGNDNRVITQQIIDLFEQPGSENCRLIIAEVRYGATNIDFSHSIFADLNVQPKYIVSPLWAGTDFETTWWKQEVFTQIALGKLNQQYARSIAAKAMNIKDHSQAPQQAVDVLLSAADGFNKIWGTGHMPLIYDLQSIRTMMALADAKGVPFKWFCWSTTNMFRNNNSRQIHDIFEKTTRVFDSIIPEFEDTVVKGFEKIFGESEYSSTLCECKHNNEVLHSWVADQIQPNIIQALNR